jgi:hypothetical protein
MTPKYCPTCGQAIPDPRSPKKICIKCHCPIRRNQRWHFEPTGPMHNDCQDRAVGEPAQRHQRMLAVVKEELSA